MSVVAPEVLKDFRIFVESQEPAGDLDGKDFRVAELGEGPRSRRRPRSAMRSSMRQKTATMKVLRS